MRQGIAAATLWSPERTRALLANYSGSTDVVSQKCEYTKLRIIFHVNHSRDVQHN